MTRTEQMQHGTMKRYGAAASFCVSQSLPTTGRPEINLDWRCGP